MVGLANPAQDGNGFDFRTQMEEDNIGAGGFDDYGGIGMSLLDTKYNRMTTTS